MTTILCTAIGIAAVFGYLLVVKALWNNTLRYWDKAIITLLLAVMSAEGAGTIIRWIIK